jgi:hypothetical protein
MKLNCPACAQKLNLPDHLAGKAVRCPACAKRFLAPASSAEAPLLIAENNPATASAAAPPIDDQYSLLPLEHQATQAPPSSAPLPVHSPSAAPLVVSGPSATGAGEEILFCPECGAKWRKNASSCDRCEYNSVIGAKLRPAGGKRRRFSVLRYLDVTPLLLLAAVAGAIYGIWWLKENWESIEQSGSQAMNRAGESRQRQYVPDAPKPRESAESKPAPAEPARTVKPETPKTAEQLRGAATAPKVAAAAASLDEKVAAVVALLRDPMQDRLAQAELRTILQQPQGDQALGLALIQALNRGKKESFEVKFKLASLLAGRRTDILGEAYALCLAPPEMSGAQAERLRNIARASLPRQGAAFEAAVRKALTVGAPELKAATLRVCGMEGWKTFGGEVRNALNDVSPVVRRAALEALGGKLGEESDASFLADVIAGSDPLLAVVASRILCNWAIPAAKLCEDRLRDLVPETGKPQASFAVFLNCLRPLMISRGAGDVQAKFLMKAARQYLEAEDPKSLGKGGMLRRWETAVFVAPHFEQRLRLLDEAAAVGRWSPKGAALYATVLLADPQATVRRRAAWVLSELSASDLRCVAEGLSIGCLDEDWPTALSAADAFVSLPAHFEANDFFTNAAATDRERVIVEGIFRLRGRKESAGALRTLSADADRDFTARAAALRYLVGELGPADLNAADEVRKLVEKDRHGRLALRLLDGALAQSGDPIARRTLLEALPSVRDQDERAILFREFRTLTGKDGGEALLETLKSGSLSVAEVWVTGRLMLKYRDAGLLDALLKMLPQTEGAGLTALIAIVADYGAEAAPGLLNLLTDRAAPGQTRARAAQTFGEAMLVARNRILKIGDDDAPPPPPELNVDPAAGLAPIRGMLNDFARLIAAETDLVVRNPGEEALRRALDVPEATDARMWEALLLGKTLLQTAQTKTARSGTVSYEDPLVWKGASPENFGGGFLQVSCVAGNQDVSNNVKVENLVREIENNPAFQPDGNFLSRYVPGGSEFRFAGAIWREGTQVKAAYFATIRDGAIVHDLEVRFQCRSIFWAYHKPLLDATLRSFKKIKAPAPATPNPIGPTGIPSERSREQGLGL